METAIDSSTLMYTRHFRRSSKKKCAETSETIDASLPSIAPNREKVNAVRGQLNQTKSQIMAMEAKLHGLRKMKEKYERRESQAKAKAEWARDVKERVKK